MSTEKINDTLNFENSETLILETTKNDSVSLKEGETKLILVETIQQFRMRYVIQVPKGKHHWALDTVALEEADELSQKYLGEVIVSSRVADENEIKRVFFEDNPMYTNFDISNYINY